MKYVWYARRATILVAPPVDAPPKLDDTLAVFEENGWEIFSVNSISMQPEVLVVARAPFKRPTYLQRLRRRWRAICGL